MQDRIRKWRKYFPCNPAKPGYPIPWRVWAAIYTTSLTPSLHYARVATFLPPGIEHDRRQYSSTAQLSVSLTLMLHGLCPPSGRICIVTALAATEDLRRVCCSHVRDRVTANGDLVQKDQPGASPAPPPKSRSTCTQRPAMAYDVYYSSCSKSKPSSVAKQKNKTHKKGLVRNVLGKTTRNLDQSTQGSRTFALDST